MLLPVGGVRTGMAEPVAAATSTTLLLPVITLAVGQIAVYMRLLRSDMIATLQENFITMAKAKGLSDRRILWRHALRPSSLTLLTVAGLNFGTLIGGAVVVEVIFQIPGMGTLIYQAINARQFVELQSYIALIAIFYVLINFVIDFLYVVLDPRIRRARRLSRPTRHGARRGPPRVPRRSTRARSRSPPWRPSGSAIAAPARDHGVASIAWMAFVVLGILGPYLPLDDPRDDARRAKRPCRRRQRRATSSAATSTGATCFAAALGRPHLDRHRDARSAHRLRARRHSSASSAATSGAGRPVLS